MKGQSVTKGDGSAAAPAPAEVAWSVYGYEVTEGITADQLAAVTSLPAAGYWDWTKTLWAEYLPNGTRVIHFTDHPPGSGHLDTYSVRDDGEHYLLTIAEVTGRSLVPTFKPGPQPGPGHIQGVEGLLNVGP